MNVKLSRKAKSKMKTKEVQFNFYLPDADTVSLAGDFNNWDAVSLPMRKNGDGFWEAKIDLRPGKYEYRLLVNGSWYDDPNAYEKVENPFGTKNCVMTVI